MNPRMNPRESIFRRNIANTVIYTALSPVAFRGLWKD